MRIISFLLVLATSSAYASSCFQEASKYMSNQDAAQMCRGVGNACYDANIVYLGFRGAADACKNVTSDSCFNEAYVYLGWRSSAEFCKGVDEDCFNANLMYKGWRGSAEACK